MKRFKIYIIISLIALVFAGCGDAVVDLKPRDQFTTDVALSTLDGLEAAIYGVYERGRFFMGSNDVSCYQQCQTDLVMDGTNLDDQAPFRAIMAMDYQYNGSLSQLADVFNAYYIGINRANLIINGIDNLVLNPDTEANRARRDQVLGEAYFFRAYFYYQLVVRWENIVLNLSATADPNAEVKLVGNDVVFPQIFADLDEAIALLPETTLGQNGRASKGVAHHLAAKAYLYTEDWENAAAMAEKVINDPAYELQTDLKSIFAIDNQENAEIIFSWQFSFNDKAQPQRFTHQWYPLYDRVEGLARTFEQGGRAWSRIHPNEYYWSLFDEDDARLEAWHMREWYYDDAEGIAARTDGVSVSVGDVVNADNVGGASGLGIRAVIPTTDKFREDSDILGKQLGDAEGFRNIPVYRLSEAYLIAAEAYWRAGNEGKGLGFINQLRIRAQVPEFSSLSQDIILEEHARELGHEGHRWEMLKRMGLLVERVKAHNTYAGPNIQDYHTKFPLPKTFVDLTGVPQNEGYTE